MSTSTKEAIKEKEIFRKQEETKKTYSKDSQKNCSCSQRFSTQAVNKAQQQPRHDRCRGFENWQHELFSKWNVRSS